MNLGTSGLSLVSDDDLKKLLRALHHGTIACPLTLPELARNGLQHCADQLTVLRGLEASGVTVAVIVALNERMAAARRRR